MTSRQSKSLRNSSNSLGKSSLAVPVAHAITFDEFATWTQSWCSKKNKEEAQKVSILALLLSHSTCFEKCCMIIGLIMATISGLGVPAWLVLLAKSLDKFSNLARLINEIGSSGSDIMQQLNAELFDLVLGFLYVGIVALISGVTYVALWTYTGECQSLRIQESYVRAALQQDAAWLDANDGEDLPTQMGTAMLHVRAAIGRSCADFYSMAISAAGCLAVALVLNGPLALIMLCAVPIAALVIGVGSSCTRRASQTAASELAQAGTLSTEVLFGIKTVASLNAQRPWALDKYATHVMNSQRHAIRGGLLNGIMAGLTGCLFYGTYTLAFLVGTDQVAQDATLTVIIRCIFDDDPNCRVTGASVMCCIYGVILFVTFFGLMGPAISTLNLGRQAGATILNTIHRKLEMDPNVGMTPPPNTVVRGDIEWKGVYFAYPTRPNQLIFTNFNLKIPAGSSLALVGPSGSGKSTIARLLLKFYNPIAGSIRIDDYSLADLKSSWWRNQVGYVAQEPILFPGTIRYNIAVGKNGTAAATDQEVIDAAKAASAHDFILKLPDGYDTFFSGGSINLSGGQLQRICIARALIKQPTVLLLDEATSALDPASERHVTQALAKLRSTRPITTITVAHRLATILNSDQIAVIAHGNIAELGTHASLLLKQDGIYAALCASQGIITEATMSIEDGGWKGSIMRKDHGQEILLNDDEAEAEADDQAPSKIEKEVLTPLSRIWKYTAADSGYTLLGLLGSIMVGALSPCESILTANIVANFYIVSPDQLLQANRKWILSFLIFAVASLVGSTCVGVGWSVCEHRLSRRMRLLAFENWMSQTTSMDFFDVHSVGELTTRLGADAALVAGITGLQLGNKVRLISSLVTGMVIALVMEWRIGLVALACVPLIALAGMIQAITTKPTTTKPKQQLLSPATILEQGLRGITSIQAYNLQETVGDDYAAAAVLQQQSHVVRRSWLAGCVFGFSQFAIFITFAVIFLVGSQLLTRQEIGFVDFFAPVLAVMFGALGASQVSANFAAQQQGQAAAARILETVDMTTSQNDHGTEPSNFNGGITYKNVQFAYPTRPDFAIFYKSPTNNHQGLQLEIKPKESVAFVGASGCGKSTAQALVLRFYQANAGSVLLLDDDDGHHDVSTLNVTWLRNQIGYVGQNPVLFSGSVKENLLLGKPDATQEEIETACRAANAHDFIIHSLPNGYDSDIGSTSGSLLSGGQRQRIAIARAILSNPPILILDEATSALDNESELVVQRALEQQQHERTTLTVAHRLTSIQNCDRIAVFANGGIQELGSHQELLQDANGLYTQLWKLQQGGGGGVVVQA